MIDDHHLNLSFCRSELQPNLFLDRCVKTRRSLGIVTGVRRIDGTVALCFIGRPFQVEVVSIMQAGLIDDGLVHEGLLHPSRDVGNGSVPYSKNNLAVVRKACAIAGPTRGQCELWSTFCDLNCVRRKFAGFVVKRELETRDKQFLKHQPGLREVGMAYDVGHTLDIEMRAKER